MVAQSPTSLMADAGAGVGEGLAFFGDELPVVAFGLQGEPENAEGGVVANFAVWLWFFEGAVILSAGTDDKFADATLGVGSSIRRLWSKALVVVVVAIDDHVRVGLIEGIP